MATNEPTEYSESSRTYRDLVLAQLSKTEETVRHMDQKLDNTANDLRNSIRDLGTQNQVAMASLVDRINSNNSAVIERVRALEIKTETFDPERLRAVESDIQAIKEGKSDTWRWVLFVVGLGGTGWGVITWVVGLLKHP